MASPVVVICGRKGSGKDTFASMLLTEGFTRDDGFQCRPAALADPLKEMVRDVFRLPAEVLWGTSEVKESTYIYGQSVRHLLQWFGTEVFREHIHQDFWVHQLLRKIMHEQKKQASGSRPFAWTITDCRFPSEWTLLQEVLEHPEEMWLASRNPSHSAYPRLQLVPESVWVSMLKPFTCLLVKIERPDGDHQDCHPSEASVDRLDQFNPIRIDNDGTIKELRDKAVKFYDEHLQPLRDK